MCRAANVHTGVRLLPEVDTAFGRGNGVCGGKNKQGLRDLTFGVRDLGAAEGLLAGLDPV